MKRNHTPGNRSALSGRSMLTAISSHLSFILLLLLPSFSFSQGCPIPNVDFDSANVYNWVCKSGWYGTGPCPTPVAGVCPTFNTVLNVCPQMNPNGIDAALNTGVDRQTIMDANSYGATGIDPNSIAPWLISTVSPFGGPNCFRLGDEKTGGTNTTVCYTGGCLGPGCYARAEAIRLTFMVTLNNAGFTYAYSAFLMNGGHLPEEQPRFEVLVTQPDSADQLIPCGYYKVVANNSNPYCPGAGVNFHTNNNAAGNWQYSDWTTVALDLTSYVGQNIAVEFRTSDCFPGSQPTTIINGGCTTTCQNGVCCTTGLSLAACPDSGQCSGTLVCTNQPGSHSAYAYIAATCGPSPLLGYNPKICVGPSVTIHGPPGYCTYSWSPINYVSTTDSVVINNPVVGTTYTVDMVSCTGCASRTTITLNGTDAIVRDTSFCAGTIGFDSLYLVPIANNPVFSWDSAGVTGFSTSQNPVIPIPSVTTTYTITVTDTSTNCTVVKMETINITPPPTPQITPPFAICAGGTAVITAGGGVGYSWSTGDITSSISVTPITTATYYVTVTNAAGCISTDSTTITVNSPLPVVATAIPPSICVGGSSMLSVAAVAGGQYIWTQSGTGTMTGATTNTPSVTPNGTETYTVVVTDANGCITFGLDTVTVNPNPIITVSSNPSTLTVCQDSSAILTASGAGAGGSYSWNGPGLSSTTTDTTTATPPSSNTSYTVIGTTINGCIDSAKVIIIIAPPLTVTVDSANICSGTCAQLNATASGGGVNFNWAPDPTLSSLTVSNPTACPFVTTTYSVTASNSSNCPSATGSGTIIVHPIPPILVGTIPPLVGTDTTILAGDTLVLTANGGGTTYNWWSESGFSCSNCPQISASPLVTTLYFVTTIDQFGCRNTDSILVKVDDVLTLYIPSAFTPDDKNSNNTMFYAYGIGIHTFEFYVFDRWGNKMFESTSPYVGWDGTFKGQKVQEDVYVYLAKARSITGKSITKTGAVTVVK